MTTLTIFAKEMNALAKTFQSNVVTMQKEVAEHVVDFVSNATPVDTGQASGNWITQIGSPSGAWNSGMSNAGVSLSQARAALVNLKMGQTVNITNNVPYITKLNAGSSTQAPSNFVEAAAVSALGYLGRYNLLIK